MKLPEDIEHRIRQQLGLSDLTWQSQKHFHKKIHRLQEQMYRLSEDFSRLKPTKNNYSDAYFAYNFPMNLMKVKTLVYQLKYFYPELFPRRGNYNICDIGCGEGAGMFGIYYGLQEFKKIRFTGFDISSVMLKKCKFMMQTLKVKDRRVSARLYRRELSHGLLKKKVVKYDIIIMANVLTEMFTDQILPVNFVERILKSCADSGIILITEPATKNMSRRLMTLRENIIAQAKAQVLMPCLHVKTCPLLDSRGEKDWCHQSMPWRAPDYMKILNQGLNREIDRLKFSYLVLAQKNFHKKKTSAYVVISSLLQEKGRKRCYLCTQNGRIELVRLNRHKSLSNKGFDTIRKSDIITLSKVIVKRPDYWQVTDDTEIKILHRSTDE